MDLADGTRDIAILNRGLPEYEVLRTRNTIALTLFRGIGWIARPDLQTRISDAGPLIAVPDAQCLRTMNFHYALLPHSGNWQQGCVSEWAAEFTSDLLVMEVDEHQGPLADSGSCLSLEDDGKLLQVTAIKRSEDGRGVVVRFYNPTGKVIVGHVQTRVGKRACEYIVDCSQRKLAKTGSE